MQDASNCEVTWSFDGTTSNVFYAFQYWNTIFASLNMWKGSGVNVYSFTTPSSGRTEVVGNLSAYHKQEIKRTGAGQYDLIFDNTYFKDFTTTSTGKIAVAKVMGGSTSSSTAEGERRFRVMRATFGDNVFLIPVVKGNQKGFYNTLDGQMFLADQECLSEGKAVGAPYTKEVEYLESTGTQWIETPAYVSYREDFEVECSARIISNQRVVLVGDYQDGQYTHTSLEIGGTSNSRSYWTRAYAQIGSTAWDKWLTQYALNSDVKISMTYNATTRNMIATDGTTTQTATFGNPTWTASNKPLKMFLDWRNSPAAIQNPARIYRVVIKCGSSTWDFIPVRFLNENGQQEGAMYDKVSKQLFRNKGTGSFTIGPDKI